MNTLVHFLPTLQIIFSVLLILGILLNQSEESLGGAFGGSDSSEGGARTRRGSEKFLFRATITLAILFTLTSIVAFLN